VQLPSPSATLESALRLADFADAASMSTLQREVTLYAFALRAASAPPSVVAGMVRGIVDDSLPVRVVPIRTSESRARLLRLAEEWSAAPTT
jgi:hypothetical protein